MAKRSDIKLRRAERSDGPRLCELFRDTAMKADLHLTVERDPDFFALYDLQDADTYLAPNDRLAPAYTRFRTTPLQANLYLVSKPGNPYNSLTLDGRRPGIEIALV